MQIFYSINENCQSLKLRAKEHELPLEAMIQWFDEENMPSFQQPFVIDHGKRVKDVLAYYKCNLPFFSEKFRDVLADFVEDIDQYLLPVCIEGVDGQYYVFHDLPVVGEMVNRDIHFNEKEEVTCFAPYSKQMHLFTIKDSRYILISPELKDAIVKAKISNLCFNICYGADDYNEYLENKTFLQDEKKRIIIEHGCYYHVFRSATMDDIPLINQIAAESKVDIPEKNSRLWHIRMDEQSIKESIARGEVYIKETNDYVEGYVVVSFEEEKAYKQIQGNWLSDDGKYAVIRRLAVKDREHGVGRTSGLLMHIEYLAKEHNLTSVRFDISEDNAELLAVLELVNLIKTKYEYCGVVEYSYGLKKEKRHAYEKLIEYY